MHGSCWRWVRYARSALAAATLAIALAAAGLAAAAPAIEIQNPDGVPFPDRLVMNRTETGAGDVAVKDVATARIVNSGDQPLHVTALTLTGPFQLAAPVALPATVPAGGALEVAVRFVAHVEGPNGGRHDGTLTVASDAAGAPSRAVELSGFWQPAIGGTNEGTLAEILGTFGYATTIVGSGQKLQNNSRVEAVGDEVLAPYWRRADLSKPVTVRQLGAFHGKTEGVDTFAWHPKDAPGAAAVVLEQAESDYQTLLPRRVPDLGPGQATFTPPLTSPVFGFRLAGQWSDPALNPRPSSCVGACGHMVRFWPIEDRAGVPLAGQYLATMDFANATSGNYDYQDDFYLVGNVMPADAAPDTTPPTLTGRQPAPSASGVALGANVVATFSEAMSPASLSAAGFSLAPSAGGTALAASITPSAGNTTFTLDPSADLAPSTQYTASVTTAAEDAAGNNLAAAQSWSFTTASAPEPGGTGAVTFAGGLAAVEAEDLDAKVARSGDDWLTGQSPAGSVGAAVRAVPDDGSAAAANVTATMPELRYRVSFPAAGTYYLWLRMNAPDGAGNSAFTGLDGTLGASYLSTGTFTSWTWLGGRFDGARTTISVPSAGEHTVNVWMREDGLNLDRLVIASSSSFSPTGTGPAATPRLAETDTTPPTLSGRQPAPGATGVAPGSDVVATFSEAMNPATLTASSFALAPSAGGSAVSASIGASAGNTTFTLNPAADLAPSTQYTATVTTAASDAAGNALTSAQTWSFTTAAAPATDTTPPTLSGRQPAPGATGVAPGSDVVATFSEAMNPATLTASSFALAPSAGGSAVSASIGASAGNTTFTLNPAADLAPSTQYTATVTTAASDAAGNALTSAQTWSFTTAAAPQPGTGAVSFVAGQAVVEAEDHDLKIARSGKDWLSGQSPAGSVAAAMKAVPDTGAQITGSIATTAPELAYRVAFPAAGTYQLWLRMYGITNGNAVHAGVDGQVSVQNLAVARDAWRWIKAAVSVPSAGEHTVHVWMREDGVSLDRLLLTTSTTFTPSGTGPSATPRQPTTDTTPPTLTGRQPAPGATGAALGVNVVATFSEAMSPASLSAASFSLAPSAGGPALAAAITASAGNTTFTLDPSADLAPGTQYTATITTAAEDAAGNDLAATQTWSFTTAAAPAPGGTGAVTFASGQAVVEAEDFDAKVARSSRDWTATTSPSGFVGRALQATPDAGTVLTASIPTSATELAYRVLFPSAGTYYLWLRGSAPDGAGNSIYAGLDGTLGPSYLFINTFGPWGWMGSRFSGERATLAVPSAGEHTVHLWMREDGLRVDRLLLTATTSFTPSGTGPAATPRQAAAPVALNVNFQSETAPVPAGHLRDFGQSYGSRTGASQGSGLSYGWVVPGTHTPLSLVGNGRDRDRAGIDQRLDTLLYMQGGDVAGFPNATADGAWEIALQNGTYTVTAGIGDGPFDATQGSVNIEGGSVLYRVPSTPTAEYAQATATVRVIDGRLTVDPIGGDNTKLNFVELTSAPTAAGRPSVAGVTPANGAEGVMRDAAITADVVLPNLGAGVDAATLTSSTVRLVRVSDGAAVPATLNTSGGGDVVVVHPQSPLEGLTAYRLEVTAALEDVSGAAFLPFKSVFTTGTELGGGEPSAASFTKLSLPTTAGRSYTGVLMGPDGKLYAGLNDGTILRFPVLADGTLGSPETITALRDANGGSRLLIGMAFDPASTAAAPVLWVSHSFFAFSDGPDWTGEISRMSGSALGTVRDVVVGLPRSIRDHVTNGLAFGPDGALYVNQGSNSSAGAADSAWGNRPERLLSAAVLRVDTAAIGAGSINVKTEDGGSYDPFAASAPVTIHASGLRNAFDLVWHSNGELYVPTNGAGFGGSSPATPAPLPAACQRRVDDPVNGDYTGPSAPGLTSLPVQRDYLFRVRPGGYYGHPNPTRCEWVLNGGNPTAGADRAEVAQYPVGTLPDRNWRGAAFDFGEHFSPNGVVEYRSGAFGGALRGRLIVARFSSGDDLIVLTPGGATNDIVGSNTGVTGFTGFSDPIDLVEHPATGNLYVAEYGAQRITLLRPQA